MTTAIVKIEHSDIDHTRSTTVGSRLKMYIDQASVPLEDINVFAYEVIPSGTGLVSMFIGIASPSDMLNLPIGEPVTPVLTDIFRLDTVDLLFRSDIPRKQASDAILVDIKEYFRLKTAIDAIPGTPFVVVIT